MEADGCWRHSAASLIPRAFGAGFKYLRYAAEIFYGAMRTVPKGQLEAARAIGMSPWQEFWSVTWPNTIRLAWPSYTNEVVFLFHATTLVYFTLPVINDQKDLMNKAGELFEKDYNVFLHFSVAAMYFVAISMTIFFVFGLVQKYLSRHIRKDERQKIKLKPNYIRWAFNNLNIKLLATHREE